jgi:hypothetical protein
MACSPVALKAFHIFILPDRKSEFTLEVTAFPFGRLADKKYWPLDVNFLTLDESQA